MKKTVSIGIVLTITIAGILYSEEPAMIFIQGGTFTMGANDSRYQDAPEHDVSISSFWIGETEVTVGIFRRFLQETGLPFLWKNEYSGNPDHRLNEDRPDDWPITGLNWELAIHFCNWLSESEGLEPVYRFVKQKPEWALQWDVTADGYRLPTEAEWEYAARGGPRQESFAPARLQEIARQNGQSNHLMPIREGAVSSLGLYGMYGNALEYCWDFYHVDYYRMSPERNPPGPAESIIYDGDGLLVEPMPGWRVVRSQYYLFHHEAVDVHPAERKLVWAYFPYPSVGFRLARSGQES